MSARVGVLIFPGTNSEEETWRACRAVGLDAELVSWNAPLDDVRAYAAYVLPGGFAYEDRVRAGAIAAHDRLMSAVREGAAAGKPVLGICNGAQILLESGLAPQCDGRSSRVHPQRTAWKISLDARVRQARNPARALRDHRDVARGRGAARVGVAR
jgi:phosphoribosylformylglycinamidine (FGAM) synthase-like amidotransferase family enzyme